MPSRSTAADQLVRLQQQAIASTIKTHLGVVSPCSTCKNNRIYSDGAKAACPRRAWAEKAKDEDVSPILTESGSDSKDSLVNPVYSQPNRSVLLWVATLEANQPAYGPDGTALNSGNLLDGTYDTDWIVCEPYPYTVTEGQAAYYHQGAYKESDQLLLHSFPSYQTTSTGERVQFGGAARKLHLLGYFSFQTADEDLLVSGT